MENVMANSGFLISIAVVAPLASIFIICKVSCFLKTAGDIDDKKRAANKIKRYCSATASLSILLLAGLSQWDVSNLKNDGSIMLIGIVYLLFRYSEKIIDTYIEEYL